MEVPALESKVVFSWYLTVVQIGKKLMPIVKNPLESALCQTANCLRDTLESTYIVKS